ncbi:MAG: hypothetical protein K8R92_05565 [Planctomycetes bacterium]|nr:hypothetical protein [Planctomycetota bacterium]
MDSMKSAALGLLSVACLAMPAWAQCDLTSPGDFLDTTYDNSVVSDDNGGWNVTPNAFMDLGTLSVGTSVRVAGIVGAFTPSGGSAPTSRDLDWIRFTVPESCYVQITLSMGKDDGFGNIVPFATGQQSYLSVYEGSVQASATNLSSGYDSDGCPQSAVYTFPNGTQQGRLPVAAGEVLFIVSTPFNPTGQTTYNGPIVYRADVFVTGRDNAACSTSVDDCITATNNPGCSDGACCDLVCGFSPQCCDTKWDALCVQDGVEQCGNFIYSCANPSLSAPNDCVGDAELVLGMPANISFDCTDANSDGPNDVTRLCTSSTSRDVWYIVGPMPTVGDLSVTMCGQGNTGDAVISLFDLGPTTDIGNPQDLPSKYVACRDDVCDDDGDGDTDFGGPAGITLIGVPADSYYLVRVGSFLDSGDPDAPGFAGAMQISFRASLYDNGRQKRVKKVSDGSLTNLYFTMGYVPAAGATPAKPSFALAVPVTVDAGCTVDGFEFCGFQPAGTVSDTIHWYIYHRGPNWLSSWGTTTTETLVAQGTIPYDSSVYSNINTDYGRRYFLDLPEGAGVNLEAGDYYFAIAGEDSGSATGSMGQFYYAENAIPQQSPTSFRPAYWGNNAIELSGSSWGRFAAVASPTYVVQTGDNPDKFYKPAVKWKGQFAPACFGDLDGSGEVDGGDIGLVLLDFGPCPSCPTDLDGSGEVDGGDIGLVLLSFGACM